MRKLWFNFLILCALLLAACTQAAPPDGSPASSTPVKPTDTAASAKPTRQANTGPTMQCNVVSMTPTQGPTEVSMFPPVSEKDWVLGDAKTPSMTVIEYSDFQ